MDIRSNAGEYYRLLDTDTEGAYRKFFSKSVKFKMKYDQTKENFDIEIEGLDNVIQSVSEFNQGLKSPLQCEVLFEAYDQEQQLSKRKLAQRFTHEGLGEVDSEVLTTCYWGDGKIVEEHNVYSKWLTS